MANYGTEAPSANVPPTLNRGAITISIMLATIMQAIDTTIANVALPHIQGSLSAAQDQITWVLISYIVAAAIMTPLTGWLAGAFGIKRVFLISVAGFTAASVLCGMAESLAQIVLFRLLQGVCGAALMPLSQAVLLRVNPPERHGQAMAVWGTGVMIGPVVGPALGGWLADNYDWRWVFYINLDRHHRLLRYPGVHPRDPTCVERAFRFFWLRRAWRGDWRVADATRPRRAQGLVPFDRDLG
jgi:DHA2 family multidrug resistance protein